MSRYEVHYWELWHNHLSADWERESKSFETKQEAIDYAKSVSDKEDVDNIEVYKRIDWK